MVQMFGNGLEKEDNQTDVPRLVKEEEDEVKLKLFHLVQNLDELLIKKLLKEITE